MDEAKQWSRMLENWKLALGQLPVPLRASDEREGRYVLLNGSTGNFCLDFVGGIDQISQRAAAWSCDVGHYVTCSNDQVVVNQWAREAREERYSWKSIAAQLHEFHQHLENTTPDRSRGIVAHVLTVFRRIRSVQSDGSRALRILLHLLAAATDENDSLNDVDLEIWGLAPDTIELSGAVSDSTWRPLYNDLLGIGRYAVLSPDFHLVLRHAAGSIFEEAHLQVVNPAEMWLPGLEAPAQIDSNAAPSEYGAYFTPGAIARTLAEEATRIIRKDDELFLFDPACGSGELLKECLRILKLKPYVGRVNILGWDKSPAAVDMARFVLAWEKRAWPLDQLTVSVQQTDSVLAEKWPSGVNVLVMNPPFKSWELMSSEEQSGVKNIVGSSAKPNLAMAFAQRAVNALSECGTLAMVLPNSLLEGKSGTNTREEMANSLSPQLIARLGDQNAFSRALVDCGLYVGVRKPCESHGTAILWSDNRQRSLNNALRALRKWRGAEVEPLNGDGFSVYLRDDIARTSEPWKARGYDAWSLYKRFEHSGNMLLANEMFDVRQGIRLGNDAFIILEEYWKTLRRSERRFFRPAVMNPSISDGRLSRTYYCFYPYTDGLPRITAESDLREHVPQFLADYLLPAKPALEKRKTLASQTELKWWDLLRSRGWQTELSPKLVSKYFGGPRSFAFDSTGEFVVVVGNAWILKKDRPAIEIQTGDESYFVPTQDEICFALLSYLSSSIAYDLLQYLSVQVAGGQLDMSNKYTGALPIPDLSKRGYASVQELIDLGRRISDGTVERLADIDELVIAALDR